MRTSRAPRVARGAVAASISTFVALAWHVAAGGAVPGALGIAVPWVLSFAVCTLLAGKTLSLARLAVAVTVSQALFHVLFVVGTIPAGASIAGSGAPSMAHQHGDVALTATTGHVLLDVAMLLAHLAAAAVTTAALHRGEALVRRMLGLARGLTTRMRVRLAAVSAAVPARPGRPLAASFVDAPRLLGRAITPPPRRGPPRPFAI